MRASLPATLVSLLLPSLIAATAARSSCLHLKSNDLSNAAACGDKASLRQCFGDSKDPISQATVEKCLVDAGCTPDESVLEARWMLDYCDGDQAEELRRRRPDPLPAPTPVPQDTTTAAAVTTAASTLVCKTSTNVDITTCPVITTGAESGKRLPCSMTSVPTMVCAAGLLCQVDKDGNQLCMQRVDTLDTGGAIIAIFLAIVLTSMIVSIAFLCCRDRREHKRIRARAEAAAIAKANAANKTRAQPMAPVPMEGNQNPFNDPAHR